MKLKFNRDSTEDKAVAKMLRLKTYRQENQNMTTEKLLSVRQVAEYLGVRIDTVRRYIKDKSLIAHKLGKDSSRSHWRIKESDLHEFVTSINRKDK